MLFKNQVWTPNASLLKDYAFILSVVDLGNLKIAVCQMQNTKCERQ